MRGTGRTLNRCSSSLRRISWCRRPRPRSPRAGSSGRRPAGCGDACRSTSPDGSDEASRTGTVSQGPRPRACTGRRRACHRTELRAGVGSAIVRMLAGGAAERGRAGCPAGRGHPAGEPGIPPAARPVRGLDWSGRGDAGLLVPALAAQQHDSVQYAAAISMLGELAVAEGRFDEAGPIWIRRSSESGIGA